MELLTRPERLVSEKIKQQAAARGMSVSQYVADLLAIQAGHPELVQRGNRKEDRPHGPVTITRYVCDHCGTAWEYENDKTNLHVGWSVIGR